MCNFLQVFYEIDDTGGAGAGEVDHFAVIINLAFQKCKGLIASYLAWLSLDQSVLKDSP